MRTGAIQGRYKRKKRVKKQKGKEISPKALEGAAVEPIGASLLVIPSDGGPSITVVRNTGHVCGPSGEKFNDSGAQAVIDHVTQAGFEVRQRTL